MINPLFYKGNPASKYVGRVGVTIFGNAIGDSIVDAVRGPGSATVAGSAGGNSAGSSSGNSSSGSQASTSAASASATTSADGVTQKVSLQVDTQSVAGAESVGDELPPGYTRTSEGRIIEEVVVTGRYTGSDPSFVSTNASFYGITDAQVDANIAAGKTSSLDAVKYAAGVVAYDVHNFLTAGFVKRYDQRLIAKANGQISSENFYTATALDAAGSVASIALGGRAGGLVLNRFGTGYAGSIASGAAAGGVFDLTQQGTQLGINAVTGGQTGQKEFSLGELALATGTGAALGGAFKYASDSPLLNRPLQSPVTFPTSLSTAYTGVPISLRSPLVSERLVSFGSDLAEISGTIEQLGQRALRLSGGDARRSEQLFEGYLQRVENRLNRVGSDYGIEIQPAALEGGERVPAFIYLNRGGPNSALITGADGAPRLFAFPGSRRLDAGVIDTTAPANRFGLKPVVAGFDITLNARKPNIVPYYQENFGNIPIYDIRLP